MGREQAEKQWNQLENYYNNNKLHKEIGWFKINGESKWKEVDEFEICSEVRIDISLYVHIKN